jgi:hypothetical protein
VRIRRKSRIERLKKLAVSQKTSMCKVKAKEIVAVEEIRAIKKSQVFFIKTVG